MMWESSWGADYPDGDNFMQLLYGPNSGQSNNGCYESKAFDAFYEKVARAARFARAQPAVPRDVAADGGRRRVEPAPVARAQAAAAPVGEGFKKHPILHAEWRLHGRRAVTAGVAGPGVAACNVRAASPRSHLRSCTLRRRRRRPPIRARCSATCSRWRRPASTRRRSTTSTRRASSARSSRRSTRTTTSRGPRSSCRRSPTACRQVTDDGRTYTVRLREGHPLRGRSGVRRQEARAHRRRRRVLVQAARRSEDPLAVRVPDRGQVRRPRRPRSRRRRNPASSTTTRRSRDSKSSTATRCASG